LSRGLVNRASVLLEEKGEIPSGSSAGSYRVPGGEGKDPFEKGGKRLLWIKSPRFEEEG